MILNRILAEKKRLRGEMAALRNRLTGAAIIDKSTRITARFEELPEYQTARTVHTYVAWRSEVRTQKLIRQMLAAERQVIVPLVDVPTHSLTHYQIMRFADLRPGAFGIPEPSVQHCIGALVSDIDCVVVPGLAFDLTGRRLGYGGGYYDAFLRQISAPKVGFAFQLQIVDEVPVRVEDERMDIIVTEEEIFRCGN